MKSLFEFGGAREKDSSLEHQNWALSNNDKCEEKHKMVIVGLTGKFTEKFENLSKKFEQNEQPVVKPHSAAVRIRKRRSLRDSNRRCINIFEQPKPDRYTFQPFKKWHEKRPYLCQNMVNFYFDKILKFKRNVMIVRDLDRDLQNSLLLLFAYYSIRLTSISNISKDKDT